MEHGVDIQKKYGVARFKCFDLQQTSNSAADQGGGGGRSLLGPHSSKSAPA